MIAKQKKKPVAKKPQEKPVRKSAANTQLRAEKRGAKPGTGKAQASPRTAPQDNASKGVAVVVVAKNMSPGEEKEFLKAIGRMIRALMWHIRHPWKQRDEFKFNRDANHPQHVFEYENGEYVSVGITHDDSTFGKPNMPLQKNPDPRDQEPAYIRNGYLKGNYRTYEGKRVLKGFKFSQEDRACVKSKERNVKKNRKKKTGTHTD